MTENTCKYIIGNYGNESIALLQWCIENRVDSLGFIYVETGWAAERWPERVAQGEAYAKQHGIDVVHLKAPADFGQLVLQRCSFPSKKFQWCAGFLKGLAINKYLDQVDDACEALLMFAKRKSASRSNQVLAEYVEESEHYNERTLWHPILEYSQQQRDELITRAGFEILPHPSLECSPCIHASDKQLSDLDLKRLRALEEKVGQSMFDAKDRHSAISQEDFDMGCGAPFACGE